jgi:hypothetical protein
VYQTLQVTAKDVQHRLAHLLLLTVVQVTIVSHLSVSVHVWLVPSGNRVTGARFGFVTAEAGSAMASMLMRPAAAPSSTARLPVARLIEEVHVIEFSCLCDRTNCTLLPSM